MCLHLYLPTRLPHQIPQLATSDSSAAWTGRILTNSHLPSHNHSSKFRTTEGKGWISSRGSSKPAVGAVRHIDSKLYLSLYTSWRYIRRSSPADIWQLHYLLRMETHMTSLLPNEASNFWSMTIWNYTRQLRDSKEMLNLSGEHHKNDSKLAENLKLQNKTKLAPEDLSNA